MRPLRHLALRPRSAVFRLILRNQSHLEIMQLHLLPVAGLQQQEEASVGRGPVEVTRTVAGAFRGELLFEFPKAPGIEQSSRSVKPDLRSAVLAPPIFVSR